MKKIPHEIDILVGSRIRLRRVMVGMSQERLGNGLGITFQQVKKYEKGKNRVGASRLQHIASILEVPVSFFFEGSGDSAPTASAQSNKSINDRFNSNDCIDLLVAYDAIDKLVLKQKVLSLVKSLGRGQSGIDI